MCFFYVFIFKHVPTMPLLLRSHFCSIFRVFCFFSIIFQYALYEKNKFACNSFCLNKLLLSKLKKKFNTYAAQSKYFRCWGLILMVCLPKIKCVETNISNNGMCHRRVHTQSKEKIFHFD